jgi:hypothetical protein
MHIYASVAQVPVFSTWGSQLTSNLVYIHLECNMYIDPCIDIANRWQHVTTNRFKQQSRLAVASGGGDGVGGHGGDTAVIVAVARHPDIATHAPASAPRVFDYPVILAARGAITNDQHTMIERGRAASGLVVDTAAVQLERRMGSIDGNRYGANGGRGSLESGLGARLNILVGAQSASAVGSIVLASAISSGVGVAGFSVDTMVIDDVLESIIHQSAIATLVALSSRAVDQVLFRKADELSSVKGMSTFKRTRGRERPAGTALTLVLYTSDNTLGSPIHRSRESVGLNNNGLLGNRHFNLLQTFVKRVEFLKGEIGKLVHSGNEAQTLLVEFLNELVVVLPVVPSGMELILTVDLVVSPHPLDEVILQQQVAGAGEAHQGKEHAHQELHALFVV